MPAVDSNSDRGKLSESSQLTQRLLAWYEKYARSLPWRGNPDPYVVWVSEIMLQQTRVDTVMPYFQRWMEQFPTLRSLADAPEQDVLKAWEGLGYYSRARNLHRTARQVSKEFNGQLPADAAKLALLPGIGRYTAGAITSIAFGLDEPALDGNIRRVLSRLFDLRLPARSPEGEHQLWDLAKQYLPAGRAGDYNQALMDLGATICIPHSPLCSECPLEDLCQARALGLQEERPIMVQRQPIPHYLVTAAIIFRAETVLIAHRPAKGLLGSMWEFPGGKLEAGEDFSGALKREIREELGVEIMAGEPFGIYRHAYTHFRVTLHAFLCELVSGEPQPLEASELRWVKPAELDLFPMGKIDRLIAARIQQQTGSPASSC
ncbi:MAG: A/G-specific adenine glycosylase [Anaerolineaceae bacterium]|nr:A/G-specific adenine glycosylase [Anaerolineaceae bacterium]